MSTINFPINPNQGQIFNFGGRSWQWNGRAWQSISTFVGFTGSQGAAGNTGFTGSIGFTGSLGGFASVQEIKFVNQNFYTIINEDVGKLLALYETTNTSTLVTVTIPNDSTLLFEVGQRLDLVQYDNNPIAITGAEGVTVFAPLGSTLNERYSAASVIKIAANSWLFIGPQATGFTGSKGDPGEFAAIGFTGSQGFTGSTGAGFTGSAGPTGFTGSQGIPGEAANIGFTGSSAPGHVNLYQSGPLQTTDGTARWYAPYDLLVTSVIPRVVTPANQDIVIDIRKNGSSIAELRILQNQNEAAPYTEGINLLFGDFITVAVTQVGTSGQPGAELYVQFRYSFLSV
jgi:hypothetical protein